MNVLQQATRAIESSLRELRAMQRACGSGVLTEPTIRDAEAALTALRAALDAPVPQMPSMPPYVYGHETIKNEKLIPATSAERWGAACYAAGRAAERERCAEIVAPVHIIFNEDEWRVRCEIVETITNG